MGLIHKNNQGYYKIVSSVTDYINNRTIINFEVYENKNCRNKEKDVLPKAHNFLNKAYDYISKQREMFENRVKEIQPLESIKDENAFLIKYPDLKEMYEQLIGLEEEYYKLSTYLLQETIDKNTLKYYKIWETLGLEDTFLNTKIFKGNSSFGINGILENTREALYRGYKKVFDEYDDDLE